MLISDKKLFTAAADGNIDEIIHLMIFATPSALVNIENDCGITPLMFAAMSGKINAMKCLIMLGADLYVEDDCKKTACSYMYMNGYAKFIDEIKQFYVDRRVFVKELLSCEFKNIDEVKRMINID